jgi:HD-like signal output (HDOD) protein
MVTDIMVMSQKNKVLLKIRQASDIPAMADTVNIINKFKSSEDSSVTDLANILLKDYALTTKILKVVNSVYYLQSGMVTTISRAIFLMGIEHIRQMALTLMLFDHLQKRNSQSEIMDAIIQAFCGGVIAKKIVEDLNYVEEEEAFICALLHPLGKIIVAHTMPEKLAEIRLISAEQGVSEDQASASVLGISFEEIGITIATEWNYPQKIVQSMYTMKASEVITNPQDGQKLSIIATLSTEMSSILVTDADREEKALKVKKLLSSYSGHLPTKRRSVESLISTSVQDFNKLAAELDLNIKTSSFSDQLDKWSDDVSPSASDTEVLSFKTDSLRTVETLFVTEEQHPETIFSKGIQEINSFMLGSSSLNDVIRIALETIYQGMKESQILRVLFFVRDLKRPQMEIRLGFGQNINEAKNWFTILVGDFSDIFNMAISKDNDLIIRDIDSPDIKKYIPAWYKSNLSVPGYIILFPVTINKKNIGLICIEGDRKGFPNITRGHLNYLRILRDQVVFATKQSLRHDDKPSSRQ